MRHNAVFSGAISLLILGAANVAPGSVGFELFASPGDWIQVAPDSAFTLTSAAGGSSSATAEIPAQFTARYDEGYSAGYDRGYDLGLASGKAQGKVVGTTQGHDDGYHAGWGQTYGPAYDLAYTKQFPLGQSDGQSDGILSGYYDGVRWARATYAASLTKSGVGSYDSSGVLSVNVGGVYGSGCLLLEMNGTLQYSGSSGTLSYGSNASWNKVSFDLGYSDGKTSGNAAGWTEGYNITFQPAYDAAFPKGLTEGNYAGTSHGTVDGGVVGYDDGWSLGFDGTYYDAFDFGVNAFRSGDLTLPAVAAIYHGPPSANQAVPEPSTIGLLGIAMMIACRRGARRRF